VSERRPAPPPELAALYQEMILDHFRRPRNKGPLADATASAKMKNPLCGDEVEVQLVRDGDVVREVHFTGCGCSISQASASMMTQAVGGRALADVTSLAARFAAMLQGAAAPDAALGALGALSGVARVPARVPCAMLPWTTLLRALGR
jgi:nitrogen fixation protein NifU and related proteins